MRLDYENFQVIINENTGNWMALENQGAELYERYAGNLTFPNDEVKEFMHGIKKHLDTIRYADSSEKGLSVLLTNMCNFECLHCYYSSSYDKPKMLEYDEVYRDFIKRCAEDGFKWICFSGGEPLLNKNLDKFVLNAIENGFKVSVLTNGSLIDDGTAKFFADNHVSVQISLDGTGEIYETIRCGSKYSRTIEGLKKLRQNDVATDISFLPSKLTIPDFENIVNVAKKYNVYSIHMPFLEIYGRATKNYELLHVREVDLIKFFEDIIDDYFDNKLENVKIGFIENIKDQLLHPHIQNSCKACRELVLGIDYNNKVYPCSELIMDEYCIGKVSDSLSEIRNTFRQMIHNISTASVDNIRKCTECPFKVLCGGGCRVQALIAGNVLKEDKYCEVLRRLYIKILGKIVKNDIDL